MFGVVVPIGLGGAILFFLWIYCVIDVIVTDSMLTRNLPKGTWLFLVIFIPTVGSVAWLVAGRPEGASLAVGGQKANYANNPYRSSTRGYEDSPDWKSTTKPSQPAATAASTGDITESAAVRERRLLEWEAELRKREDALGEDTDS